MKRARRRARRGPGARVRRHRRRRAARATARCRNARGLPLRDVSLHVDSSDVSGRAATLEGHAVYGVRGMRGTFDTTRSVRARRTKQGWRVRSESTKRERFPWELGPVQSRRSPHFVVLAPQGLPLDALMTALEAGYARMGDVLKKPRMRRRYLVVVAGAAQAARALTARISGVESLAAISDAEVQETGSAKRVSEVVSQRLVVVWPPFSALDADGQRRVVTHELTHAALAGVTSGRTPSWLIEGIALYVSEDRRSGDAARYLAGEASGRARRALSLRALSEPDAIARLSGDGQAVAYAYASAASFSIADRFGRRRFSSSTTPSTTRTCRATPGLELTTRPSTIRRALGDRRVARPTPTCTIARAALGRARAVASAAVPELPEVETIRRHLAPHVEGRMLREVEIRDPRWSRPLAPAEVADGGAPAGASSGSRAAAST